MKTEIINPIWVAGQIDAQQFYVNFTGRLSEILNSTKPGDIITVMINSQGGDAQTALGIYDLLKNSDRKTIGYVTGTAQSGASLILQACGERRMTEHSTLLLHKSTIQIGGSVANAEEALKVMKMGDDQYYQIYAKRAGEKVGKISEMAHKDKYFTANEALEAGLADAIV